MYRRSDKLQAVLRPRVQHLKIFVEMFVADVTVAANSVASATASSGVGNLSDAVAGQAAYFNVQTKDQFLNFRDEGELYVHVFCGTALCFFFLLDGM